MTVVPEAPLGVIVTGIVPVWPGATVIGVNEARLVAGFALSASRSPVGELTVESNGAVAQSELPARLKLDLSKQQDLRYGENPHQAAALYVDLARGSGGSGKWCGST